MAIIGKWSLNGNANAQVGTNGTATSVTWVDGKSNGAGSFNGTSSYIQVLPSDISGAKSISFLLKSPSNSTTISTNTPIKINTNETGYDNDVLAFSFNHTNSSFQQSFDIKNTSGTFFSAKLTTALLANTWYYIVGTFDGTTLRAYLNGKLEASTTITGTMYTGSRLWMGKGGTSGGYFNGNIDEVEIHNVALTATEIKNKYLAYNGFI